MDMRCRLIPKKEHLLLTKNKLHDINKLITCRLYEKKQFNQREKAQDY